MGAFVPCW
uniref:Uncharacterized protein n=1 Tax=Arundo donax TaxID=35708 RepID=A0A0A9EJG0_ARUDO